MKIAKNLKESAQAKAKAESTTLTDVIERMLAVWTGNTDPGEELIALYRQHLAAERLKTLNQ